MKSELTLKQRRVYEFIAGFVETHRLSPSLREIGRSLRLSVGTVQDQVEAIRRKGFLRKEEFNARGLVVPFAPHQVPVVGRVHAGPFHAALENLEGYLPVDTTYAPSKHFALRVRGDSMINAGILDGDMVIVRLQANADDGDIVVARLDDEATVKWLRRQEGRTFLEAANPAYPPIVDVVFSIVGVVVEIRRTLRRG
jgi:repressor LexA